MKNTQKKICLITGASSGIGFAIAKELRENTDYQIIITARRTEKMEALKAANVDILSGDLNSVVFQNTIKDFVYKTYGKCDYLFNCAGSIEVGTIEKIDIDRMADMLRLNIESTFRLTYLILKAFKKQGFGHVINISSVLGTKVRATAGAYSATKFAIEALSEALRMELTGTRIQITCIEPGLVMTELHNNWEVHPKDMMGIHHPLSVDDVVEIVKFVMSRPDHVRIPKLMILPKDHNI